MVEWELMAVMGMAESAEWWVGMTESAEWWGSCRDGTEGVSRDSGEGEEIYV